MCVCVCVYGGFILDSLGSICVGDVEGVRARLEFASCRVRFFLAY